MSDTSVVEVPDAAAAVEANELAAAQELYDSLKPYAEVQARDYIMARMPPAQAALMQDQIDADFPPPPPPPEAVNQPGNP